MVRNLIFLRKPKFEIQIKYKHSQSEVSKLNDRVSAWKFEYLRVRVGIPAQTDRPILNQIPVDLYKIELTPIKQACDALASTSPAMGTLVSGDKQPSQCNC